MAHDVVVLGGGPGGYGVAFRAAVRGLDVAMIEADAVGGTCLHRGCIPSKSLLHVADVVHELQRDDLGIDVDYRGVELSQLRSFRDHVVGTMHRGIQSLVEARGIAYHDGFGRIVEPGIVEVDGQRVQGRHLVIATGSVPRHLPGVEIDGEVVVTSDEALRVDRLPQRALVIGAGAIGMEFATFWSSLGTEVTVVEALDRVLPLEDEDSSAAMERAFHRDGIEVVTSARVEKVNVADGEATVEVSTGDGTRELTVDTVLVAIGRRPNVEAAGVTDLGVVDDRGAVEADAFGRTSVDAVWAVGDVLPTLALAHAAFAEGWTVADAIAEVDEVQAVDYDHVPRVTYCRPEVASVGLTEATARERYDDVVVNRTSLRANAKGIISGLTGHVKVVARDGGETLGVHIVSPHATDLIGEASLATYWGAFPSEVAQIVHAHPTLYEALGETFLATAGLPFHGH